MLTHDREQAARYDSDPLIFRQIAVNVLLDLHDTAKRLVADAGAIHTPTLMIGAARIGSSASKRNENFSIACHLPIKQIHVFPEARHAIFHETNRREVVDLVREFVFDRFANRRWFLRSLMPTEVASPWRNTNV